MAKRNGAVNKSEEVRQILRETPRKPVKEIIETRGKRGIEVQPSLVYMIKSKKRGRRGKQKRQQQTIAQPGPSKVVALVVKVKNLASEAGGMGQLRALVNVLAD